MRTASISQAKNKLSALLDQVRAGHSVVITDRNQPIARIVPFSASDLTGHQGLDVLIRAGVVIPPKKKLSADFLKKPRPTAKKGASVLQALLDERAEGR